MLRLPSFAVSHFVGSRFFHVIVTFPCKTNPFVARMNVNEKGAHVVARNQSARGRGSLNGFWERQTLAEPGAAS
jgi:hypothetical protein